MAWLKRILDFKRYPLEKLWIGRFKQAQPYQSTRTLSVLRYRSISDGLSAALSCLKRLRTLLLNHHHSICSWQLSPLERLATPTLANSSGFSPLCLLQKLLVFIVSSFSKNHHLFVNSSEISHPVGSHAKSPHTLIP